MSSIGMHRAPFGLPLRPHPAALGHSSHGGSAKCLGLRLPRPLSPATTSLQRAPSNHDQEAEASLQPPLRAPACRPRACQPLAHTAGAQGRPASRASPPQLACRPPERSHAPPASCWMPERRDRRAQPVGARGAAAVQRWGLMAGAAMRGGRRQRRQSGWARPAAGLLIDAADGPRAYRQSDAAVGWQPQPFGPPPLKHVGCRPSAHAPAVAHVRRQRMRSPLAPSALQPQLLQQCCRTAGGRRRLQHGAGMTGSPAGPGSEAVALPHLALPAAHVRRCAAHWPRCLPRRCPARCRNGGRNKHGRGHVKRVRCESSAAMVRTWVQTGRTEPGAACAAYGRWQVTKGAAQGPAASCSSLLLLPPLLPLLPLASRCPRTRPSSASLCATWWTPRPSAICRMPAPSTVGARSRFACN